MASIRNVFFQIAIYLILYPIYKLFLSKYFKPSRLKKIVVYKNLGKYLYLELSILEISLFVLIYISKNIVPEVIGEIILYDILILNIFVVIKLSRLVHNRFFLTTITIPIILLFYDQFALLVTIGMNYRMSLNLKIGLMMGLTMIVSIIATIRLRILGVSITEKLTLWIDSLFYIINAFVVIIIIFGDTASSGIYFDIEVLAWNLWIFKISMHWIKLLGSIKKTKQDWRE